MDIGATLSRAWQITWRNKILWLFGILAGCSNVSSNAGNQGTSYQMDANGELQNFLNRYNITDDVLVVLGIIAAIIILALVVLFIFLGTIGRIGLIRGTVQAESSPVKLSFGELFNGSLPYFWRVFGLAVLLVLISVVIAVIVAAVSVLTLGLALICLLPLLCLLIPVGWLIAIIVEQANIAIVVDDVGIMEGLQRGWQVVRSNLGTYLVMGLILLVGVGLFGGLIIGLPLFLGIIPAGLGMATQSDAGTVTGLIVAGLIVLAYLPVLLFLNGILTAFTESAWTLTYMRLTGRRQAVVEPEVVS